MPTRIDIELTSTSGDGSWTWRAAGAREPKGVLDGSILPIGAAVGDRMRAESEHDVEGIRILSIVPSKQKAGKDDVLQLLPSAEFEPVVQQRTSRDRDPNRPRTRRSRDDGDDRDGDRQRRDRGRRGDGSGERRGPRPGDDATRGEGRPPRTHRPHFTPPPELPQRPKPKRLRPTKQHLGEVLGSLPEEQRAVAELALQGMAAVRQRLREDNARSRAERKPEMPEATVLKMAEDLLPQLRVADWRDRAEAAQRQLAHLDLRDLRSVVAAAEDPLVARDESTRSLAVELKRALGVKQDEELALWLGDVEAAVDVGRVVRALRLSAVPPKAGVPFPPALGSKLAEASVAALTAEDPSERWIAVLEAAAFSPIRSLVTPATAPAKPSPELVATVTRLGPLLPQIAALFGIEVAEKAPTPKPLRPAPRKKEAPRKSAAPAAKRPSRRADRHETAKTPAVDEPAKQHDAVQEPALVEERERVQDSEPVQAPEALQEPEVAAEPEPLGHPEPIEQLQADDAAIENAEHATTAE